MIINGLCVDYGSRFCPCILAETGGCVVCSQVNGKDFCDCKASGGVCIKQELLRNGGKAKPGRMTYEGEVMSVIHHDGLVFFRVKVPLSLEQDVKRPGGFVFIRRKDAASWYDVPISVQYEEMMVGSIGMTVLLRGVKTFQFKDLSEGDTLLIRGPFNNGLLGLQHLEMQQSGRCLILTKGIGLLPSVSTVVYRYHCLATAGIGPLCLSALRCRVPDTHAGSTQGVSVDDPIGHTGRHVQRQPPGSHLYPRWSQSV